MIRVVTGTVNGGVTKIVPFYVNIVEAVNSNRFYISLPIGSCGVPRDFVVEFVVVNGIVMIKRKLIVEVVKPYSSLGIFEHFKNNLTVEPIGY
jgi:hypothetical protein